MLDHNVNDLISKGKEDGSSADYKPEIEVRSILDVIIEYATFGLVDMGETVALSGDDKKVYDTSYNTSLQKTSSK